jgi:hypothetical protein
MFKEKGIKKMPKGKAAVKNGSSKKGVSALAAKKPKSAMKPGKGKAVVANGSGQKGLSGLKKAGKKAPAPKSKAAIGHAKRAVKLAGYKF